MEQQPLLSLVLQVHLIVTWVLVGLIWTIQIVHYPLFEKVGPEQFCEYHRFHIERITWLVVPLMLGEVLTALSLLFLGWRAVGFLLSLPPLALVWLSTFTLQAPLHQRLQQMGYDLSLLQALTRTNWLRTLAWLLRGMLLAPFITLAM